MQWIEVGRCCAVHTCWACACCRTECPVGFYAPDLGAEYCLPCLPGTISNTTGAAQCMPCPAGTFCLVGPVMSKNHSTVFWFRSCSQPQQAGFTSNFGRWACVPCPLGETSFEGEHPCRSCPAGTYTPTVGSETCTDCPTVSFDAGAHSAGVEAALSLWRRLCRASTRSMKPRRSAPPVPIAHQSLQAPARTPLTCVLQQNCSV